MFNFNLKSDLRKYVFDQNTLFTFTVKFIKDSIKDHLNHEKM